MSIIDQLKRRMSVLPSKHHEVEARILKVHFGSSQNFDNPRFQEEIYMNESVDFVNTEP